MRSSMTDVHSLAPSAHISRSSFDRSKTHKTAFNASKLVPFYADADILPGDTVNFSVDFFIRMTTPIVPIMDNLYYETFYFFIPHRLVWNNFKKFMGEQDNPGDSIDYLWPESTSPVGGYAVGSLQDYLGLKPGVAGYTHNTHILRSYNLVYNEWFRDENLQNSVVVDKGDGPDTVTNYTLLSRGKRYDYFTSCLPFLQKGPAVSVPLVGNAPVYGNGNALAMTDGSVTGGTTKGNSNGVFGVVTGLNGQPVGTAAVGSYTGNNLSVGVVTSGDSGLVVDLSSVSGISINTLRQSYMMQLFLEREARGGTRYVESIKSHFGVQSPDFRLQRSEFLGSGMSHFSTHAIPQTSSTDATTPQGNLAAFTTCAGHHRGFVKSFTEHGIILGIMSVRADLTYQQGLERMWTRRTRYDMYWPEFAHLGEQSVLNKEIYCAGVAADNNVFGYQERHAEYRYGRNMITGILRSTAAQTLDKWHLAQNFGSLPVLNSSFITENVPMTRVLAVANQPDFICDMRINAKYARPMPVFGIPGWQTNL